MAPKGLDNWFSHSYRNVHVLYVSPEWFPVRGDEFDPKAFVEAMREAGAQTIEFYIKDHHGIAYYPTKIGNYYGRDLLTPLVEASHRAGMKFIAYYSVWWDRWAYQNHPEWREAGREPGHDIFWFMDANSGYGQFVLDQLAEIAAGWEIDGVFLDVPQGDLPKIARTIKQYRPDALVTWNGGGEDFWSTERHGPDYLGQSLAPNWFGLNGLPVEITAPGVLPGGWLAEWHVKPAEMLQLEAATVMANGGHLTIGLNPYPSGKIEPAAIDNLGKVYHWIAEREPWLVDSERVADVGVVIPHGADPAKDPPPGVGVLHKTLAEEHIQFAWVRLDSAWDAYPMLLVAEDVTIPPDRARDYVAAGGKLLVYGQAAEGLEDPLGIELVGRAEQSASYCAVTDAQLLEGLVDSPIGLRNGRAILCRLTGGESLASIAFPIAELTDEFYFGWSGLNPPGRDSGYPMVVRHAYGRGETMFFAATVVAELERLGGLDPWLARLQANMIRRLLGDPVVQSNAPPGVEIVVRRQGKRVIVHLINQYTAIAGIAVPRGEQAPILHDIHISMSAARLGLRPDVAVTQQPYGTSLAAIAKAGRIEISLPSLATHTMIVAE